MRKITILVELLRPYATERGRRQVAMIGLHRRFSACLLSFSGLWGG